MTQVDFYLIAGAQPRDRHRFVCRLSEKAYRQGHQIYIHTGSAEESQQLDDLLWTFSAESFVPHATLESDEADLSPILIGHTTEPEAHHDTLINLTDQVPAAFSRFDRLVELVSQDEGQRTQARDRFKFYRERGYQPNTHDLVK